MNTAEFITLVERIGPIFLIGLLFAVTSLTNARRDKSLAEATAGSTAVLNRIAEGQVDIATDLRVKLAAERETNHQKTLEIVELKGTLTDTVLTLGHRERELEDTREALEAIKRAKDTLGEQLTTLSANVGTMTTKLETLEAKLSEAEEQITRLEGQQQSMQTELDEARSLREQAERLNRELATERDRLLADNQAQAELIEQYTARLAGFEEENRLLKERLTEFEKRIEGMNHVQKSDEGTGDVGGAGGDAAGPDGGGGAG